ncbi:hypothetical protein [Desulfitobacterium hafniense]|uniref:hypothetical protein n=1 Tax=Desulfitobacterium hafniense TaxID=49338 RepID=UPI00036D6C68|nr:hypothetical protein [Desulfitobacterium hafniense]
MLNSTQRSAAQAAHETAFELSLVKDERIGDVLFLIASIIALISTYQAEEAIIIEFSQTPQPDRSARTVAASSWTFLIGSILIAYVAIVRYRQIAASAPDASPLMLKGRWFTALGDIVSVIGFGLSALGDQMKAHASSEGPTIAR